MNEFEFLKKMYFRLSEMRQIYGTEDDTKCNAAEAAIAGSIRDYLEMTRPAPQPGVAQ